jgi:hypothetical protein
MMNDAQIADFLALIPANRLGRTEHALRIILTGAEAGTIFNVDFKDAKDALDRSVEAAYKAATDAFWVGKGGELDADPEINTLLNQFHWSARVGYVRDAIAASKKLAKVKINHPMLTAMRKVVSAVLPLALVMEDVKKVIVKGRKPNPEAAARKAAKLEDAMPRATCACCFSNQAVLPNGRIHDHGYTLPRSWMKTGSCYGRQFRPLEVSNEGLIFMEKLLSDALKYNEEALERAANATEHTTQSLRGQPVVTKNTDANWYRVHENFLSEINYQIRSITRDLKKFRVAIANWKAA